VYDDPTIQLFHEFILNNGLSVDQGDSLLDMYTKVTKIVVVSRFVYIDTCGSHLQIAGIQTKIAPTMKNLNASLLKFVQGTGVSEKWMHEPNLDGKQVLISINSIAKYWSGLTNALSHLLMLHPTYQIILSWIENCIVWQTFKVVYKDVFEMVKSILKDPKFSKNLHFEGKVDRQVILICLLIVSTAKICDAYWLLIFNRINTEDPDSERVFSDMHTGLWMQRAQAIVGTKKTPIGIVFYSDKTHALQNMQIYPLYSQYNFHYWFHLLHNLTNPYCSDFGQLGQQGTIHQRWLATGSTSASSQQDSRIVQGKSDLRNSQDETLPW
jgi:hypothetical protein